MRRLNILYSVPLLCCSYLLGADRVPDASTLTRDTEYNLKQQFKPKLEAPKPIQKESDELDLPNAQKVFVKRFDITGVTLFNDSVLQSLILDYTNQELTFKKLKNVLKILATHYRENGYLAKVYFPQQDVTKGIIEIKIIEGKLGTISIDSKSKLDPDFTKKFITTHQEENQPIYINKLDRSVLILSDIPGVMAKSSLSKGDKKELTDVTVTTQDTGFFNGSLAASNTGSRSTGQNQATLTSSVNNLSSYGDQLKFTAVKSKGNQYLYGEYNFPILHDGLRGALFVSNSDYELINSYASSEAEGTAHNYGVRFNYPLIRSTTSNVNLYTKYENKLLRDKALQAYTAQKKIQYIHFGISSNFQDKLLGGANNQVSLEYTKGDLDLKSNNNSFITDQASARTNGNYSKYFLTINRAQALPSDFTLRLNSNFQYSNENLDSSEKMGLGGPYSVRAYPSSEASGDQAMLLQVELAKNIQKNMELFGFYDYGWVRTNNDLWANWNGGSTIPNIYSLDGVGLGFKYQMLASLSCDITMSRALKSNRGVADDSTNSDGSRRSNRYWLNLTYQF